MLLATVVDNNTGAAGLSGLAVVVLVLRNVEVVKVLSSGTTNIVMGGEVEA